MSKMAKIGMFDVAMTTVSFVATIVSIAAIAGRTRIVVAIMFGIVFVLCAARANRSLRTSVPIVSAGETSHVIRLLNEQASGIYDWDLDRRTSMLIGKSNSERTADIDLAGSAFAAMTENEHAVLNFAAGEWYLEDVSENGRVSIERSGLNYVLDKGEPCVLSSGDVVSVAQAKLLFV
jgi:hypothetical protein